MRKLEVGDVLRTKKKHPCGSDEWEVIRNGADVKIKCRGCGHVLILPRMKFLKMLKP